MSAEVGRPDGVQVTSEIREAVSAQQRRRRMVFWLGFLAILVAGALWAGLSKDPLGPDFFEDEFGLQQTTPTSEQPIPVGRLVAAS